jgi:hypothetical protein
MIGTRNLSGLPDVDAVRRLMQSLAMLDAVLCPAWEDRYYSFNAVWSAGGQMGSMRNGQGDDFFARFSAAGCWLKGFAHESPMTPYRKRPPQVWRGVLDDVPDAFADCLTEPAFNLADTTFCIWRQPGDAGWHRGRIRFPSGHPDPDGSAELLSVLDGRPETYLDWAQDYYGESVDLDAVRRVYAHERLTDPLVSALNPEATLRAVTSDRKEIGYPNPSTG